ALRVVGVRVGRPLKVPTLRLALPSGQGNPVRGGKGTQTKGGTIILTPGEVEFARSHPGEMALFILHSIQVSEGEGGFVLSDGECRLILPWDVDRGSLKVVSYQYDVPGPGDG